MIVCQMISKEAVVAIIGPQSEASADHVQSMCQSLQIPHIQTHPDSERLSEISMARNNESHPTFSVNIYPDWESISRVCMVI